MHSNRNATIATHRHIISRYDFRPLLALLFALSLLAGGCGAKRVSTPPGTTMDDYRACPRPEWVDNMNCESGICAIGLGKSMDYGFAREKAEADARNKLAMNLEAEVRNLYEQLKEENRDLAAEMESSGIEFTSSVTQQLTTATLSGARARRFYTDCVTHHVYAELSLDMDLLHSNLKAAVQSVAERNRHLNRELARQAVDRMNRIIDQRRDEEFAQSAGVAKTLEETPEE